MKMEWSEAQDDRFIVGHCVHCDTGVDRELQAVARPELDSYGYAVVEDLGCGNPDCGGGRCLRS
jgi:hypothetical protein